MKRIVLFLALTTALTSQAETFKCYKSRINLTVTTYGDNISGEYSSYVGTRAEIYTTFSGHKVQVANTGHKPSILLPVEYQAADSFGSSVSISITKQPSLLIKLERHGVVTDFDSCKQIVTPPPSWEPGPSCGRRVCEF